MVSVKHKPPQKRRASKKEPAKPLPAMIDPALDPFATLPVADDGTYQTLGGRPTILTRGLVDAIMADVRKAVPLQVAARKHGINKGTLGQWKKKGRAKSDKPEYRRYRAFLKEYLEAKSAAQITLLKDWRRCAKRDWRGAQALLTIINRGKYGDKQLVKHQHEGRVGLEQLIAVDELEDAVGLNKPLPPDAPN